jgi:hypothetical protein
MNQVCLKWNHSVSLAETGTGSGDAPRTNCQRDFKLPLQFAPSSANASLPRTMVKNLTSTMVKQAVATFGFAWCRGVRVPTMVKEGTLAT